MHSLLAGVLFVFAIILAETFFDKRKDNKRKLEAMNDLYLCSSCHRYSRKYYIDLKERCDSSYADKKQKYLTESNVTVYYKNSFCPHCEDGIAAINFGSEESWIGKHPDAPLLKLRDIKLLESTRELGSIIAYESTVKSSDRRLELEVLFEDLLINLSTKRGR